MSFDQMSRPKKLRLNPSTILSSLSPAAELNSPPPLLALPIEILQEIYEYLPLYSKAILSITCKPLLRAVGTAAWINPSLAGHWNADYYSTRWSEPRTLPNTPEINTLARVKFLQTIARDVEHLSYCGNCMVLHPNLPHPAELRLKSEGNSPCMVSQGVLDRFPREGKKGYTLIWEHVKKAMDVHESAMTGTASLRDYLTWETQYMIEEKHGLRITEQINTYTTRSVGRNLIFKHEHHYSGKDLLAGDVLGSSLTLCAHLTTTTPSWFGKSSWFSRITHRTPRNLFWTSKFGNSPMLTYAINQAFPKDKRCSDAALITRRFRPPYAREQSQMFAERKKTDYWWCRSCPTKFRVVYEKDKGLTVTAYHNLGTNAGLAKVHFNHFVWKEHSNWEFGSLSRTFADFDCEQVEVFDASGTTTDAMLRSLLQVDLPSKDKEQPEWFEQGPTQTIG